MKKEAGITYYEFFNSVTNYLRVERSVFCL
jgi:hypothetical protein